MTVNSEKLYEAAAKDYLFEIADVRHAAELIQSIGDNPDLRIIRLAKMLAVLREHYVQIGRELESIRLSKSQGV